MLLSDIVKKGIENKDNKTSRYVILKLEELDLPVFVSLETDKRNNLDLKMYETDLYSLNCLLKPFIENPYQKENIFINIMNGSAKDGENIDNPRPICELSTVVWNNGVTLANINTREDFRRKGVASYALKLVQDYYARNNETKEKGLTMLYSSKRDADKDLAYKTKFEQKMGSFGDIVSRIRSKILCKDANAAYENFLLKNHFCLEPHEYQVPHRTMRRRDILSDEIINDDNASNYIQIFDSVIEYDLAERCEGKSL